MCPDNIVSARQKYIVIYIYRPVLVEKRKRDVQYLLILFLIPKATLFDYRIYQMSVILSRLGYLHLIKTKYSIRRFSLKLYDWA